MVINLILTFFTDNDIVTADIPLTTDILQNQCYEWSRGINVEEDHDSRDAQGNALYSATLLPDCILMCSPFNHGAQNHHMEPSKHLKLITQSRKLQLEYDLIR
jgi:hypothetical protein